MLIPSETSAGTPRPTAPLGPVDVLTVFCDGCGAEGGSSADDYEEALAASRAAGWIEANGRDYCRACQDAGRPAREGETP